jgi:hypothetical protein
MAEMNKIKSFKSFSDVLAHEATIKLAVENNAKREELSTKIASILDSMEITSLEGLDEEQKTALISQLFGEISEEEVEGESDDAEPVVNDEEAVEEITEAIKVEGKRDAKKVVTVYNKIFNKVLVDLGAMSNESILGCIKYLMHEAMVDANFHREALPVSKMIKGNIKPLEIKMAGLGGHFVKIGPATIKTILDKYYSDIANAAGWGGQGIVEGTALYLEQIKQEGMGQAAINQFNQSFEGESIRIDLDSKLNESNDVELITVSDETTKLEERNAFLGARAKAIEEDLEEFEFNGKMYPVTVNESTVLNEGTRGQFGKIDKSGNITSVYTHYDSYPENMLPIIKKSFKNGKNVDDVLSKGANSGLSTDISKINFYNDGTTNTTGSIKNIDNYLKDADRDGGAEFVYLWDEKSKKWMMADIYQGSGLIPAFESVVTEGKSFSEPEIKATTEVVADAIAKVYKTKAKVINFKTLDKDGKIAGFYIHKATNKEGAPSRYWVTDSGEVVSAFRHDTFGDGVVAQVGDKLASVVKTFKANESIVTEAIKCSNKKGHAYKEIDNDGTVECEYCGLRNSLSESVVTEAKFVKDFNRDVLNAKTKEEVLELYPNAEFFIGKSDHFFGELDGNLFFKAYYTKAQKEFEIKSVYSEKGSNYVHLYNESVVNEASLSGIEFGNDDDIHPTKFKPLTMSLKKNKVKMEVEKEEGDHGYPEVKLTGKREDIEKVLADVWGPDSISDYEDYFESVVNEAEVTSDEEFKEYAFAVLQKAFGDDFDEAKGQEIVDGILSKSDGDYGAAVGMLTSSLG